MIGSDIDLKIIIIMINIAAVSYTHLRAHETVLDLVCRLLLEKKNKTTTSTDDRYHKHKPAH